VLDPVKPIRAETVEDFSNLDLVRANEAVTRID
jgi:hypothetical protein